MAINYLGYLFFIILVCRVIQPTQTNKRIEAKKDDFYIEKVEELLSEDMMFDDDKDVQLHPVCGINEKYNVNHKFFQNRTISLPLTSGITTWMSKPMSQWNSFGKNRVRVIQCPCSIEQNTSSMESVGQNISYEDASNIPTDMICKNGTIYLRFTKNSSKKTCLFVFAHVGKMGDYNGISPVAFLVLQTEKKSWPLG